MIATPAIACMSIVLLLTAGCGPGSNPKPPGFPDTVPCVITITQEGGTLEGATVTLVPDDGAKDWMFNGTTNASGAAVIRTYGRADGAPKGKYKVTVSKVETDPSKLTQPDPNDAEAMYRYGAEAAKEKLNSYDLVEAVYSDPKKTTLTLEITGDTAQTLDVGKKVRVLRPPGP